jgi:hypothetical protein
VNDTREKVRIAIGVVWLVFLLLTGAAAVKYLFAAPAAPAACPCNCCPCPKPTGYGQRPAKGTSLDFVQVDGERAWFGWTDPEGRKHEQRTSRAEFERMVMAGGEGSEP